MPPPRKNLEHNAHKGPRQKHLNVTKFDPYRHGGEDRKPDTSFLDIMSSMCCRRCALQLHWKVEYGKFVALERPRKCNVCHQKTVALAYHHVCQPCCLARGMCGKCQKKPLTAAQAAESAAAGDGAADDGNSGDGSDPDDEDKSSNDADSGDDDGDARGGGRRGGAAPPPAGKRSGDAEDDDTKNDDGDDAPSRAARPAGGAKSLVNPPGFIDGAECGDPDLEKFAGLDVSRYLRMKRRQQAQEALEERAGMRERERRTVMRKLAAAGGEDGAALDHDSDEELSD